MSQIRISILVVLLVAIGAAGAYGERGGLGRGGERGERGGLGRGGDWGEGETQRGSVNRKSPESSGDTPKKNKRPIRFIWPTSGRKIVERYGERRNPRTGTVTINPGINIAAVTGSAVVASEEGKVSLVSWLPSYGTIVIVEHRESYRTVYGSLAKATVKRGAQVRAGERIGTVKGGMVHFEVWKGQTRMDPLTVLKK